MVDIWYTDKVARGTGGGKKLGFPTVNLNAQRFLDELKDGVYSCDIEYENKLYKGALYFGRRFITRNEEYILEIHIFDFDKIIYGKTVEFKVGQFIRAPIKTKNTQELIDQIKKDVEKIKAL